MKNQFISLLTVCAAVVALVSCDGVGGCIKGNGKNAIEKRAIDGNISGIEMNGSFDVYVTKDTATVVEIEADSNLLPFIITRLRSGLLLIDNDRTCFRTRNPIKVYVRTPFVNKLILDGSGKIEADSIDAQFADIELNGSGEILVSVLIADDANVLLDGSGEIRLDEVTTGIFDANHGGSGFIQVEDIVSDIIELDLDGSGEIEAYRIKANKVNASLSGSGSMDLDGDAILGNLKISGSGNLKAFNLFLDECDAYISGSGSIYTHAIKTLTVDIPGSGFVYYRGTPRRFYAPGTDAEQVKASN
jgi:hypothetical protein